MPASAVSQANSPANIPVPQAKPDAKKADAASPFALMMDATAREPVKTARKDTRESADDKPAVKQNDGKQDDAKQNDARQNDVKQNDARQNDVKQNDNAATAQNAAQPKPAAPAKSSKPEKDKEDGTVETGKDVAGDLQVVSAEQQAAVAQVPLPPPPVTQAPVMTVAAADTDSVSQDDTEIDAAAPVAPGAGTPDFNPAAAPAAADETAPSAPQTQIAAQPDQADDTQAADTATAPAIAAQVALVDAKPPVTAKDSAKPAKIAAKSEPATAGKPDTAVPAKDDLEQAGSAKGAGETVHTSQAQPAKTDIAKADTAKIDIAKDGSADGMSPQGLPAQHGAAGNAKTDTGASDGQKTDAPQADARPVDPDSAALAAAKPVSQPVPQSATASNAIFAINTIAAPQAAQHSQAPVATQHVQVTAQAQPNLPALAVEISAKSQSGAKQFDIRLDPPELGRVEVRLSIDATGKASAHLSADQPQTLHLLQKDAPVLTRALREAGLDVSQDGLNFSLRQQAQDQQGHDGSNGRVASSRAFSLAATASIDPTATSFAYRGLADGRVDIRV